MNRQEHLEWCKARALEYVAVNDLQQAVASMVSDLGKHEETKGHAGIGFGVNMIFYGLPARQEIIKFIESFN